MLQTTVQNQNAIWRSNSAKIEVLTTDGRGYVDLGMIQDDVSFTIAWNVFTGESDSFQGEENYGTNKTATLSFNSIEFRMDVYKELLSEFLPYSETVDGAIFEDFSSSVLAGRKVRLTDNVGRTLEINKLIPVDFSGVNFRDPNGSTLNTTAFTFDCQYDSGIYKLTDDATYGFEYRIILGRPDAGQTILGRPDAGQTVLGRPLTATNIYTNTL